MTRAPKVAVLDYGSGNVRSAVRALAAQGAEVTLSADPVLVQEADGLVVPGVGAFAAAMQQLRACGADRLIERRLAGGGPVLGICVGMQFMFDGSSEPSPSPVDGLGLWHGRVERLDAPVVPHMGWSQVEPAPDSRLFAGVEGERFYFVHSFAAPTLDLQPHPNARPVHVTTCTYGERFVAAVENGPLCATQFHPEKSGAAGLRLLRNWVGSLRA